MTWFICIVHMNDTWQIDRMQNERLDGIIHGINHIIEILKNTTEYTPPVMTGGILGIHGFFFSRHSVASNFFNA